MIIFYSIIALLFLLVTIRNLNHAVVLLLALLPSYLIRFSVFGIPSTMLEMFLLIVICVWIFRSKKNLINKFKIPLAFAIPVIILLIASIVGIFVSPNLREALGIWKAYYFEPIIFFFLLLDILKDRKTKASAFRALGISAIFIALVGIAQKIFHTGIPIPWDLENRITSVFEYPNAVGLFLSPILILSIAECVREWKNKSVWKWFWFSNIVLSSVAIYFAQTEAAYVAIFATLFLIALQNNKFRKPIIATLAIFILILTISPLKNIVAQKIFLQDYSGQVKLSQWSETIKLLKDHTVFGAGLNGYPTVFKQYHTAKQYEIFQYPHNIILNIWVELGLLGLFGFFWLSISVCRVVIKNPKSIPIAFFVLFEICIHGLVDVPYFKNDLAILTWFFIALFISTYVIQKEKQN